MNNKTISAVVIIILVIGGFLIFKNRSMAPTVSEIESNMPIPGSKVEEKIVVEDVTAPSTPAASIKEFNVNETSFSFSPSSLVVNKGDTVKITVKNIGGTHDLKIDEFSASTRRLGTGEGQTITFVADKSGTFEYYCSVGTHRALGMVGTLTVR